MKLDATPRFRGGQGSPILLLHAGWTTWRIWQPLLHRLTPERDVLAITMFGHMGGPESSSQHPPTRENIEGHILAELDAAGFECPDVVGNSIGGFIAFELARRGRARSVVALGPEGKQTRAHGEWLELKVNLAHRALRAGLPLVRLGLRVPAIRRVLMRDLSAQGHRLSFELCDHLLTAFAYCDVPQTMRSNRTVAGPIPHIGDASDITCPVLFIWGNRDTFVTREEMSRYRADIPHAEFLELEQCGHSPQLDYPDLVAREILRFTARAAQPGISPDNSASGAPSLRQSRG